MDGLGLPRMRGTLKGAYKKHVGILWLFKKDLSGLGLQGSGLEGFMVLGL